MAKKRKRAKRLALADIIGRPVVSPRVPVSKRLVGLLKQGRKQATLVRAPCSCGGENDNCFKCFGTGFYDKELIDDPISSPDSSSTRSRRIRKLGGFASDSRGNNYSIREGGRFATSPLHDDYDDESFS